jgi:hypothetical protein
MAFHVAHFRRALPSVLPEGVGVNGKKGVLMPEKRRLRSGVPRMYPDHNRRTARVYAAHYKALRLKYGLLDQLARDFAAGVAQAFASWRTVTDELTAVEAARSTGKGRRPSTHAIERLRRRQGLEWGKYESGLRRLEELSPERRRAPANGAELLAGRP